MENKLGICEWVFSVNGPLAIEIASEIGFEGIQIGDLGGEERQFPINNRRVQEGYLRASKQFGIELHSLHLYTLVRQGTMLYPLSSSQGGRAVRSIRKGIEACRALGISKLMLSAFFASEIKDRSSFNHYAAILKRACEMGKDEGVSIVFESVLPVEDMLRMREMAGADLTFCYDIGNPVRWESGEPKEEIRTLGIDAIDHVHVKDIPADKIGYCLLGRGCADAFHTMEYLDALGYRGWYITENNYENKAMGTGRNFIELAEEDFRCMKERLCSA